MLFGLAFAQETSNIFWNSLSTELVIKVPIIEDESLENGQVQISATFDKGASFKKLGDPIKIVDNDIDDIKDIIINADVFESLDGFKEGAKVQFKTEIWDRVGNSTSGEVGDSILTIDQTSPELLNLSVSSSNQLGSKVANPMDSIDFTFEFNEPVKNPYFLIDGDKYAANSVSSKSWKLNYKTENSNDGIVDFELFFEDLAGNPGVSLSTLIGDASGVSFDKTSPDFTNSIGGSSISITSDNNYDTGLGTITDVITLTLTSAEALKANSKPTVTILDVLANVSADADNKVFTATHTITGGEDDNDNKLCGDQESSKDLLMVDAAEMDDISYQFDHIGVFNMKNDKIDKLEEILRLASNTLKRAEASYTEEFGSES